LVGVDRSAPAGKVTVSDTREHSRDEETMDAVRCETAVEKLTRNAGPTSSVTTKPAHGGGGSWEASTAASCGGEWFSQNRLGRRMTLGVGVPHRDASGTRPGGAPALALKESLQR